jgi:hypothetical protein
VPSFCHDAPAVRQAVHYHPFIQPRHQLQLISRIVGSNVFHPVSSLALVQFATSQSLAQILHLQRWPQSHQDVANQNWIEIMMWRRKS